MEALSCLSWSPAPVWDHSFLVSPNALECGTQRCHPLSLSSLLLFLFCPDTEAFSYRCFMVTRFCYPLPVLSAVVWIFLLCIEGLVPSLAATPRAQPCSRPGSKWAVESVRADSPPLCPQTFPQCSLSRDQLSDFKQYI